LFTPCAQLRVHPRAQENDIVCWYLGTAERKQQRPSSS
jgi:hypothetical protein